MILRHCITIVTPMGQQIIPQIIMDADLDGFINMLRMTQGVDKKQIKIMRQKIPFLRNCMFAFLF